MAKYYARGRAVDGSEGAKFSADGLAVEGGLPVGRVYLHATYLGYPIAAFSKIMGFPSASFAKLNEHII